jgi:hypothetical protein
MNRREIMLQPIVHVLGARPNFVKAAPVISALRDAEQTVVHTGQHYDERLSDIFFRELGLPEPDVNLEVGSASHAAQTAAIMVGLTLVYGLAHFFLTGERGSFWLFAFVAVLQAAWYFRQTRQITEYLSVQREPETDEVTGRWDREPDDYCPPMARSLTTPD